MDVWVKLESNLMAVKRAGREVLGVDVKPESYGGSPLSLEEQRQRNRARERIREWALSWKWKK